MSMDFFCATSKVIPLYFLHNYIVFLSKFHRTFFGLPSIITEENLTKSRLDYILILF